MALSARPFVAQLAREVLARWVTRTGLRPYLGDDNQPRPALPYVSVTFPRGRPLTGPRHRRDFSETLAAQTITPTAAIGEAVVVRANGAVVSRVVAEAPLLFAPLLAADLQWWLRGRATTAAAGADVVVTPLAPGLLLELGVVEGADLAVVPAGPPARLTERLYRATCRVEVLGAPLGVGVGETGDGMDAYTIEAALREELSGEVTRRELRAAGLVPHGLQEGDPSYATAVSGLQRETRVMFDLEFGWTGWFAGESEAIITAELDLWSESGGGLIELEVGLP